MGRAAKTAGRRRPLGTAADRPLIARALAKNPDHRFPSCMDLVRALLGENTPAAVQAGKPEAQAPLAAQPLAETLNSLYFEHDYTEEEEGKRIRKAMQTERFPADYSQRVYGQGGFLPRFVSHHRGVGAASPMYVYRYDMMREFLEKCRDWDGDKVAVVHAKF